MLGRALPMIAATSVLLAGGVFAQAPMLLESTVADYCSDCHNDQLKTGGVTLDHASSTNVAGQAALLEKVLHKLRAVEMPPAGNSAPDAAQRASLVKWLETQLDAASAVKPNPGA